MDRRCVEINLLFNPATVPSLKKNVFFCPSCFITRVKTRMGPREVIPLGDGPVGSLVTLRSSLFFKSHVWYWHICAPTCFVYPQCLLSCRMKVQLQLLCQLKIRRVSIWIGGFCKVLRRWSWTSQEAKVDPPGNQDIISHLKVAGKMIVLLHRLDMLVPRRVVVCLTKRRFGSRCFHGKQLLRQLIIWDLESQKPFTTGKTQRFCWL